MRSDRMLSIIIILSQKGLVTGKQLAEHFEVSLRTIYRDLEKIGEAGVPIASTGGTGGGYYLMKNYNLNDIFFNKKEIEPLIAVMDNLKTLFGNNKEFNDITLKFETLKNSQEYSYDKLSIDMSHFSMEQELKEYLFLINKGIKDSKLLEFLYINRNMEYEERIVEPLQIEFSDGHWYIIAYCRIRKDYRKFKLVRIRNLRLGENFVKDLISIEKIKSKLSEGYEKNSISVTLKFLSDIGEQLGEYFSKDKIEVVENKFYVVKDNFPKDDGLKKFILGFGDKCEVIAPIELREEMKIYIKNIYTKYND
ncbi:YafY family protein [Clostridium sp. YIM B02506]|uniref:helix-turn-helix transcriptional regulator n=1 Tax=Clostridium sp. YIM B02506 TaxID=2910680 RepID=UPI001EEF3FCB|nr:YafY family protein [Clostridium sp. YIM B02506]